MNTIDLLQGLEPYRLLLKTIKAWKLSNAFHPEDPPEAFLEQVSLSYKVITLELNKKEAEQPYSSLSLECIFQIEKKKVAFERVYCEKREREHEVKNFIIQQTPANGFTWNTQERIASYDDGTMRYLIIADEIAKEAMNCASGDNYLPGYYSEIIIEETLLRLKQVNHMNSKSRDHRNDYSLRELEFVIPLTAERMTTYSDYVIGRMGINFSDRSSKNNKVCGDKILEKIRQEEHAFNKS